MAELKKQIKNPVRLPGGKAARGRPGGLSGRVIHITDPDLIWTLLADPENDLSLSHYDSLMFDLKQPVALLLGEDQCQSIAWKIFAQALALENGPADGERSDSKPNVARRSGFDVPLSRLDTSLITDLAKTHAAKVVQGLKRSGSSHTNIIRDYGYYIPFLVGLEFTGLSGSVRISKSLRIFAFARNLAQMSWIRGRMKLSGRRGAANAYLLWTHFLLGQAFSNFGNRTTRIEKLKHQLAGWGSQRFFAQIETSLKSPDDADSTFNLRRRLQSLESQIHRLEALTEDIEDLKKCLENEQSSELSSLSKEDLYCIVEHLKRLRNAVNGLGKVAPPVLLNVPGDEIKSIERLLRRFHGEGFEDLKHNPSDALMRLKSLVEHLDKKITEPHLEVATEERPYIYKCILFEIMMSFHILIGISFAKILDAIIENNETLYDFADRLRSSEDPDKILNAYISQDSPTAEIHRISRRAYPEHGIKMGDILKFDIKSASKDRPENSDKFLSFGPHEGCPYALSADGTRAYPNGIPKHHVRHPCYGQFWARTVLKEMFFQLTDKETGLKNLSLPKAKTKGFAFIPDHLMVSFEREGGTYGT